MKSQVNEIQHSIFLKIKNQVAFIAFTFLEKKSPRFNKQGLNKHYYSVTKILS